jgi:hypothetical protein
VAAISAWSARETYRIRIKDLGNRNAVEVPKDEYERLRAQTMVDNKIANSAAGSAT